MERRFVNWEKLPSGLKTEIITKMDTETIKDLRNTCKVERALIDSTKISLSEIELYFNGLHSYMKYWNTFGRRIFIQTRSLKRTFQLIKEEFAKMNFVHTLTIWHDIPDGQFLPEKLRVKHLIIRGRNNDNNHRYVIEQLDVDFLESIEYSLRGQLNDSQICDLPQITEVSNLDIDRNTITDEQLLRFNAPCMKVGPQTLITPAGMNAFFKKSLRRLGSTYIDHQFTYPKGLQQYREIIEGMRVKSDKLIRSRSENTRYVRVFSPCESYVLCITFSTLYLIARREPNVDIRVEDDTDAEREARKRRYDDWMQVIANTDRDRIWEGVIKPRNNENHR